MKKPKTHILQEDSGNTWQTLCGRLSRKVTSYGLAETAYQRYPVCKDCQKRYDAAEQAKRQ